MLINLRVLFLQQVTVEPQTVIAGKIEKEELFLIEPQHTLVEEVKPARVVPGKAVEITEEEENVQLKTAEKTMKSHGVGEDEELKPIKWAPTIGD
ncbi:hypothetical protein EB796_014823 [Bugula neritina]|uniref:Uncharacterized protein n=1 Tax=Bugula neritina TaxID=10212 RepID=A0A7J7JMK0_BUGNE|nr:hypothetical protein EB796_014823 [Bugula neritina]